MLSDAHYCHDRQCGAKEQCNRWLQRHQAKEGSLHCLTLKLAYIPHEQFCDQAKPITIYPKGPPHGQTPAEAEVRATTPAG